MWGGGRGKRETGEGKRGCSEPLVVQHGRLQVSDFDPPEEGREKEGGVGEKK